MPVYKSDEKLDLRIISLKGVIFQRKADAIQVKLSDGLMVINKNYSSTVERLFSGKMIVFDGEKESSLDISEGGLVMNRNKCDLFVSFAKQL